MKKTVLFVCTKHFPFGTAEQYLVDELPSLAARFDKVVFIPAEKFDADVSTQRPLPENCEVLLLNTIAEQSKSVRRAGEFFRVFFGELKKCRSKFWFWKERKRYVSVLLHQQHLATVFENILKERFTEYVPQFYAYWIHNSSIMLGLMKQRGAINTFVCRGHSIDLYEWDWVLVRYIKILPFYHFIIEQAARVFAISQHGTDYLKKRFPQYADKFLCSRLGVRESGVNPFQPEAKFTLVSCSNFSENKRVDVIATVFSKLKIPARWIHFGSGSGMEKMETLAKEFPPHLSIEFRGFTPNETIKAFYASETVHLVINLSEAEGIPVSLMEAISFGIPVMATDVYGNPEIANEKTGFSIPFKSSPQAIADLVEQFAANTERQLKTRESARKFYFEKFNAQTNYDAFASELLGLVDVYL